MALSNLQLKKMHELGTKINQAIDAGQVTAALQKLNSLNAKFPNQPMILSLMGKANATMGRHAEAIESWRSAVKVNERDADFRFYFALALQKGGKYDESLIEYERALYYCPNHFMALRHKCSVLTDLDRTDEALKTLEALRASVDENTIEKGKRLAVAISGARLSPKKIDPAEIIAEVQRDVDNESCEPSLRTAAYWQVGRLYDVLKDHDRAFENWTKCKELGKNNWSPDQHSKRVDQLIACWTNDANIPFAKTDGSRLIFIVGMMRSGTSLTEQMLAQVSNITPGGEMNAISRQISPIEKTTMQHARPNPSTRAIYTKQVIEKMSKAAYQMYNQVAQQGYVTDKQPYNHAYVPLIAHMFPGCKIIHCVRDPMDCCLSNYTQAFSRPHMQTHDQYWLGRYYRDYERMMSAWHTIDEVDMIDLHYEELVADPQSQSKRMMEFLGIDWTPDILNFHESDRTVSTASRDQVRKPLYTSSVQKYKKYESHLDELKRGLQEGLARSKSDSR